jgi:hypothetical protein
MLSVCQKDPESLYQLQRVFGFGQVTALGGPICVYYICSFERVQAVIAMLFPWLSQRRRRQAISALRSYAECPVGTLPSWDSRLTPVQVRQILWLLEDDPTLTQTALAARFGVQQASISNIVLRKAWKQVDIRRLDPC